MIQLKRDGWIHHLSKNLVAFFLTQNILHQNWKIGRDFFFKHLLDTDFFINNSNWKLFQSSKNFSCQKFNLYCPISFYKKYDPNGDYIRYFIPALKDVPKEFIMITSKTDISNPGVLDRLFNSLERNNVQMKFGILGEPTDRFKDFLTKGRSPENLVSVDDNKDSILKLLKLQKPAQNLPGKREC